jgi:hypothetical protein
VPNRSRPSNVCDGCGQTLDRRRREHIPLGPVVHEHIWCRLVDDPRECLCFECMGKLALGRLGRMLTLVDLRPCRWNLSGQPYSWFDLFTEMEGPPSESLVAEWCAVGDPGEFEPLQFSPEGERWWQRRRDPGDGGAA